MQLLTMEGLMRSKKLCPNHNKWLSTGKMPLGLLICVGLLAVFAGCASPWGTPLAGYAGYGETQTVPPPPSRIYAAPGYLSSEERLGDSSGGNRQFDPSAANPAMQVPVGSGVSSPYAPPALTQESYRVRYQSPDDSQQDSNGFYVDESLSKDINRAQIVQEVRIEGNRRVPTPEILRQLKSKAGRYFDPDLLQQDVQAIWRMQTIRRVHGPFLDRSESGIVVTFQVEEHPVINELVFVGNRAMTDTYLRKEIGLEVGRPLNEFEIRMAKNKIQDLYRSKGHTYTTVEIQESADPTTVVFVIYEDERRTIKSISFEGNSIATDARLGVIVKSKRKKLWFFGGKLDRDQLDRDVDLLRAYYYSLGFFNAKVGREISSKPGETGIDLKFVINEGPRYRIRNVRFEGNDNYNGEDLLAVLKLKPGAEEHPFFNADSMNEDVEVLRDTYGSVGHVFADVQAQPHFLEQPGEIDLVYHIDEGKAYRVGKINVHIDGDGITKRNVVINRLTQSPGELIDIRRIRQSERLLRSAQLFGDPQNPNSQPRIVLRPESSLY